MACRFDVVEGRTLGEATVGCLEAHAGTLQVADGLLDPPVGLPEERAADIGTQRRRRRFGRKADGCHGERRRGEHGGHAGGQRLRTIGLLLVARGRVR